MTKTIAAADIDLTDLIDDAIIKNLLADARRAFAAQNYATAHGIATFLATSLESFAPEPFVRMRAMAQDIAIATDAMLALATNNVVIAALALGRSATGSSRTCALDDFMAIGQTANAIAPIASGLLAATMRGLATPSDAILATTANLYNRLHDAIAAQDGSDHTPPTPQ